MGGRVKLSACYRLECSWKNVEIVAPEPKPDYGRRARFLDQIARLRPGVAIETARGEIETVASRLRQQYPATDAGMAVHGVSFRDEIGSDARTPLLVLMAGVAFLVLMLR
jgi:hypothetical protein